MFKIIFTLKIGLDIPDQRCYDVYMNIIDKNSNICIIPSCNYIIKVKSRQLCTNHYQRWLTTGDAETPFKIARKGEPLRFLKESLLNKNANECWIWPFGKDSAGYPTIHINGKLSRATYVALELSGHPKPSPPNNFCLHSCDNPSCFNPNHLRWGSPKNNIDDMVKRNRAKFYTEGRNWKNQYSSKDTRPSLDKNEKCCIRCNLIKDLSAFYSHKRMYDGLQPNCIPCTKELNKLREITRSNHQM